MRAPHSLPPSSVACWRRWRRRRRRRRDWPTSDAPQWRAVRHALDTAASSHIFSSFVRALRVCAFSATAEAVSHARHSLVAGAAADVARQRSALVDRLAQQQQQQEQQKQSQHDDQAQQTQRNEQEQALGVALATSATNAMATDVEPPREQSTSAPPVLATTAATAAAAARMRSIGCSPVRSTSKRRRSSTTDAVSANLFFRAPRIHRSSLVAERRHCDRVERRRCDDGDGATRRRSGHADCRLVARTRAGSCRRTIERRRLTRRVDRRLVCTLATTCSFSVWPNR